MKRPMVVAVIMTLVLGCASAGGPGKRTPADRDHVILDTDHLTVVKHGKREWFDPSVFRKWVSGQKRKMRDMGAPANVLVQYENALPRTRAMELEMAEETERKDAAFCQLGFYFDHESILRFAGGGGSLWLVLESPATDETVEVHDRGLLFRKTDGQEAVYFDSAKGPVDFSCEYQNPKGRKPNVVYARYDHRYYGWTILSAHIDSNRVQVGPDPES